MEKKHFGYGVLFAVDRAGLIGVELSRYAAGAVEPLDPAANVQ